MSRTSAQRRRAFLLSIVLLASLLLAPAAQAQGDSPSDDEVNRIAKQLYCPVCENVPLDVCPTQACIQWRGLIRDQLAAGWTEAEIKAYFVERYGDQVLATPPARGINWLIYLLPPAVFLAGAFVLARSFRAWRSPGTDQDKDEAREENVDEAYVAQLEAELQARQGSQPSERT